MKQQIFKTYITLKPSRLTEASLARRSGLISFNFLGLVHAPYRQCFVFPAWEGVSFGQNIRRKLGCQVGMPEPSTKFWQSRVWIRPCWLRIALRLWIVERVIVVILDSFTKLNVEITGDPMLPPSEADTNVGNGLGVHGQIRRYEIYNHARNFIKYDPISIRR